MTRKRSTIQVATVRQWANEYCARDGGTPEFRRGVMALAMSILHETGNYRGFQYNAWSNGGYRQWIADDKPEDNTPYLGDKSRITLAS